MPIKIEDKINPTTNSRKLAALGETVMTGKEERGLTASVCEV